MLSNRSRYVATQFDKASDGSQDVGYYDLSTGHVTDISNNVTGSGFSASPTVDENPVFDANDPNLLFFCRDDGVNCDGDRNYSYNLATKQLQKYSGSSHTCKAGLVYENDASGCELPGKGATAGMGIFSFSSLDGLPANTRFNYSYLGSGQLVIDDPMGSGNLLGVKAPNVATISCNPLGWVDTGSILCDTPNLYGGTDEFDYIRVNLGSITKKPLYDGSYFEVSATASILPSNSRHNFNPVVSPDTKTVMFISAQGEGQGVVAGSVGVYKIVTSGGQPVEVKQLGDSTTGLVLLMYR